MSHDLPQHPAGAGAHCGKRVWWAKRGDGAGSVPAWRHVATGDLLCGDGTHLAEPAVV